MFARLVGCEFLCPMPLGLSRLSFLTRVILAGADFEPDGDVDIADFKVIADNWLGGK